MSNDKSTNIPNRIGFLFKTSDAPKVSLAYWVTVPEFVEEISNAINNGISINDEYIFNVMKRIYAQKDELRKQGTGVDFSFRLSRRSLRILSEKIYGNRDSWKNL